MNDSRAPFTEQEDLRQQTACLRSQISAQDKRLDDIVAAVELLAQANLATLQKLDPDAAQRLQYGQLVRRVRRLVDDTVTRDATLLVISKGDDELINLAGRRTRHFPCDQEGRYAGFTPADSGSAIAQLEAQRAKGADYLLIPATALWWLGHYTGFRQHLDRRYRLVMRSDETCAIYALKKSTTGTDTSVWNALEHFLSQVERQIECEPAVLDWGTALDLAAKTSRCAVFSPPSPNSTLSEPVLPYLDATIDVVAVASDSETVLAEARRVAKVAVVVFAASNATFSVHWRLKSEPRHLLSTSIIIPSYNGIALTEDCLKALEENVSADFCGEIIVVDDASSDDTPERLQRLAGQYSRLVCARNLQNLGFLATCNRGAELAKNDILVFLNNDTLPQQGWLEALLSTFENYPDAGAVGGKLVYPDGRLQEAGGIVFSDGSAANFGRGDYEVDAPLYNYVRDVDYVTGALIATPRALFEKLGGFDTRYKPIYYEETDYCFQVREAGLKVYYQPASVVIHLEGATCGSDPSAGQKRYQVVNRRKFMERWQEALRRQPDNPNHFDASTWFSLAVRDERDVLDRDPVEPDSRIAHSNERHNGNGRKERVL